MPIVSRDLRWAWRSASAASATSAGVASAVRRASFEITHAGPGTRTGSRRYPRHGEQDERQRRLSAERRERKATEEQSVVVPDQGQDDERQPDEKDVVGEHAGDGEQKPDGVRASNERPETDRVGLGAGAGADEEEVRDEDERSEPDAHGK